MTRHINPSHVWDTVHGEVELRSDHLYDLMGLQVSPSYIIYKDGDMVKAKNGLTGEIEFYGVDAAEIIQSVVNVVDTGLILIKGGVYDINKRLVVNGKRGLTIMGEGAGVDHPVDGDEDYHGTVLRATASIGAIFRIGDELPRCLNVKFLNLCFDGRGYANYCLSFYRQLDCVVAYCCFGRAKTAQIYRQPDDGSPNLRVFDNVICGFYSGTTGVMVHNDDMVLRNVIVGSQTAVRANRSCHIHHNHMYGWESLGYPMEYGIILTGVDNFVSHNYIDNYTEEGIRLEESGAVGGHIITDNWIVCKGNLGSVDKPCIHLIHSSGTGAWTLHVKNNKFGARSGTTLAVAIKATNITSWHRVQIKNNTYGNVADKGAITENGGIATFSGDGSTTQFSIAHGLVAEPETVDVTPLSADAAGDFYVTKDSTYIYVNYLTAPPSGTDNVVLSWRAEV